MKIIYLSILAAVLGLCLWCLFSAKKASVQATAAMVIVPLVLRLLLIN
ncbi:MAG: hypothetical protein LWX23_06115 [Spirochaetia bacterium]|jgi:hypothetical protein|uniref:Uncharacterized protein n=2 Tax=root TaxID=1 RepID=A0A652ZYS1_9SPIR|nr:hypothetical protein [Spirochaetia bacterium]MCE1209029.1 hypothetical protein [Spirochaetia bacterium]NLX45784.1 hypothetical protein [Treponema sp.]VBB40928.1 conserved hypothetical protein [uncultured Spirochaetota bacterium]HOI21984.1 hypothetical protein [Spirochaetales bacterium]